MKKSRAGEASKAELQKAEAELALERSRCYDLYDLAPVGFCNLLEDGLILEPNAALASLLGVERQDLVGRPLTTFIEADSQDDFSLKTKWRDGGGEAQDCELRMRTRDGSPLWASVRSVPSLDHLGRPVRRLGFTDITAMKRAEASLRKSLEEKSVLIKEVHHRVKNNLSVISSLLNIQAKNIKSPEEAMEAFAKTRDRIMAMALVHEELYKTEDYSRVNMREFIRKLTDQLREVHGLGGEVDMGAVAEDIHLDVSQSISCGLILNELVTNAFKYAFPGGRAGRIAIAFRAIDADQVELVVSDDGKGPPPGNEGLESHALGLTLVKLLVEQLQGSMAIGTGEGMHFRITFPFRPAA